jgi:hypothetical protein
MKTWKVVLEERGFLFWRKAMKIVGNEIGISPLGDLKVYEHTVCKAIFARGSWRSVVEKVARPWFWRRKKGVVDEQFPPCEC